MNGKVSVSVLAGKIGVLTMHHGKVNALSRALLDDLAEALGQMQDPAIRAVVLRAEAGVQVFSAGYDVRELPTEGGSDPLGFAAPLRRLIRQVQQLPKPVIAMVEGSVWGGACELVFACDLIVAGMDTTFAFTPAKLGIPYDLQGMVNFLTVAGSHLLKEMLFLAQPIAVARLEACGIVNRVVPRAELESCALELARGIGRNSSLVLEVLKEELRALGNARPLEAETHERLQALRRKVYGSEDYREGLRAFLEKRTPRFRGM